MAWFIAITNPNCHRRAEAGLASLGYRAFWPKMRKWASHARVKVPKEYPILGRYLFVDLPVNARGEVDFWTARNVNGVEGFLTGDRGEPAKVASEVVTAFLERYMAGEWDFIAKDVLPVGARVRIMEGEFADLLTIIRGRRNGRLKFLPPGRREFVTTREENARAV
jgi:transcription antitermination factor NusG